MSTLVLFLWEACHKTFARMASPCSTIHNSITCLVRESPAILLVEDNCNCQTRCEHILSILKPLEHSNGQSRCTITDVGLVGQRCSPSPNKGGHGQSRRDIADSSFPAIRAHGQYKMGETNSTVQSQDDFPEAQSLHSVRGRLSGDYCSVKHVSSGETQC